MGRRCAAFYRFVGRSMGLMLGPGTASFKSTHRVSDPVILSVHRNGKDAKMWVIKRILRWILKSKQLLFRLTRLRARLCFCTTTTTRFKLVALPAPDEEEEQEVTQSEEHSPDSSSLPGSHQEVPLTAAVGGDQSPIEASPSEGGLNGTMTSTSSGDDPFAVNTFQKSASVALPPLEDLELHVDPLPLDETGGVILIRSATIAGLTGREAPDMSWRGDAQLALPIALQTDTIKAEARDLRQQFKNEHIGEQVIQQVIVVPSLAPSLNRPDSRSPSICESERVSQATSLAQSTYQTNAAPQDPTTAARFAPGNTPF